MRSTSTVISVSTWNTLLKHGILNVLTCQFEQCLPHKPEICMSSYVVNYRLSCNCFFFHCHRYCIYLNARCSLSLKFDA
jgi:hypothetical protein